MKFITRISFLKSHKIIVSKDKEVFKMKKLDTLLSRDVAKKMIIDGEPWNKIMETTHLRLKDLKHIQREEIYPKF